MPEDTTVIREVTKGVWTFSKPFSRFGVWPIGGRSTAIQLSTPTSSASTTSTDGDPSSRKTPVWVLASTPLDEPTRKKLEELGEVQYIVGADEVHHLFLGDYKKAYPNAKLIAPVSAIERHNDLALHFEGAWGRDPPETKYGFEDEIEHCYFSGFKNKDVAFLHKPSKSLIEADLLMNLSEMDEQYSKTTESSKILGMKSFGATSWTQANFVWGLGTDKEAMRRDAKTVSSWDFERIIPCHGDVIEKDGKSIWAKAFKYFLD
ncbi:hypothetical protein D9619_011061 [Psilocybe cf. subviscida]|uniref:Uncharacterized protein n=1 Tax=Psilocybe cf. subviscida TaxID=2480587 RepID=A0A8H5B9L5_9AGAR|nr:hypothetical protein D9619_011061 [Psilocybe cf. subviscida]